MGLFSKRPHAPTSGDLRRERRALMLLREERLRDLGGLTLEMYRRDDFSDVLIVERCAELVAVEARISEIDAILAGARGLRKGGSAVCDCGAPVLIGARYCPSCGRRLFADEVEHGSPEANGDAPAGAEATAAAQDAQEDSSE